MIHRAKKSMGQNFLKSAKALSDIVLAGEIKNTDTILEIGPGKGALTEKLLKVAGKVIAVEKDRDLVALLQEKFANEITNGKLELIEGDIINYELKIKNYKLLANIPYNITGEILRKFFSEKFPPSTMVLLVQKEVAERIVSRDGKESILSLSVKVYGDPKYISKVPARYFSPAPKVDSAIIAVKNISKDKLKEAGITEEQFFKVVKAGFAHKRKVLIQNLASFRPRGALGQIFQELGIPEKSRAEELPIETWFALSKKLL
jgi:16S rRNA (adenine1518-N6/adenine1519-N6)-dimethyltransferase